MTDPIPVPLNGSKTHPLSDHARAELKALVRNGPKPSQQLNAGVVNRLQREGLIERIDLPSPYAVHKGRSIGHVMATAKALEILERQP